MVYIELTKQDGTNVQVNSRSIEYIEERNGGSTLQLRGSVLTIEETPPTVVERIDGEWNRVRSKDDIDFTQPGDEDNDG